MPIDVGWLYEDRVIKLRQYGKVTTQQLADAIEVSRRMIQQGKAPVHTISDGTGMDGGLDFSLADLKKIIPTVIEGAGLMVAIQDRSLDRFFAALGMQIAGVRYKFAKDEQEALRLLLDYDPTLGDIIR